MTRARSETMVVQPTNNVYTALAGVACIAVLIAVILIWLRWRELTGGEPLFFGLF